MGGVGCKGDAGFSESSLCKFGVLGRNFKFERFSVGILSK